jgi:hypothetical protein
MENMNCHEKDACTIFHNHNYYCHCPKDVSGRDPVDTPPDLLFARPHLWTPDVEYDFGEGLFGQRFVGSITATSNYHSTLTLAVLDASVKLLDAGGRWRAATDITLGSLFKNGTSADTSCGLRINIDSTDSPFGTLLLQTITPTPRNDAPYDIWIRYTK